MPRSASGPNLMLEVLQPLQRIQRHLSIEVSDASLSCRTSAHPIFPLGWQDNPSINLPLSLSGVNLTPYDFEVSRAANQLIACSQCTHTIAPCAQGHVGAGGVVPPRGTGGQLMSVQSPDQ